MYYCSTMRLGEGTGEGETSLEAAVAEDSVIVISDDEGDVSLGMGNSVLLVDDAPNVSISEEKRGLEVVDDELAITYSKKPRLMPHARHDCTAHAFVRAEQETELPLEENASFCPECYCYICDKHASECALWTSSSSCHCNAHNKSKYWKEIRDTALAGVLTIFNFELTEIDAGLRDGGNQLQQFLSDFSVAQKKYTEGQLVTRDSLYKCNCQCHKKQTKCNSCTMAHVPTCVYSYTPVYNLVTEVLNKAEAEHPNTTAVVLLGVTRELALQKTLVNPFALPDKSANVKEATIILMQRIVATLQRLLVLADYPRNLSEKFVVFFQSLTLPQYCHCFLGSLNILRWDDCLLTSVLAGQNLTGTRMQKGKRQCLWEVLTVVQSRVQRLEENKSYRQLVRYLNAVKCPDQCGLASLKTKMPLYMCKFGEYNEAANFLIQKRGMLWPLAKDLTPAQYEFYLTMLQTRSCPPGIELEAGELWVPCNGDRIKKGLLLRTALRILYCNGKLQLEPKCWSSLVRVWTLCDTVSNDGKLMARRIGEPDKYFQRVVMDVSLSILDELQARCNVNLPDHFHQSNWLAAEYILIVQAITRFMMSSGAAKQMLELVLAFGPNFWLLGLLIGNLAQMPNLLSQFLATIRKELNEEKREFLETMNSRGGHYVSSLISLFLLNLNDRLRPIGFFMIEILLKHALEYNWVPLVGSDLKYKLQENLSYVYVLHMSTEEKARLQDMLSRMTSRS
ncbi:uncharacterized protein [Hyperolius riggenbachi]|uniref:uncharacterized protein n=1 Tax=Hyperolius riggenbachi TaxID=752182 RepID=UPI0035A2EA5A